MVGLLLLFFIGKKFYELANEYGKNAWLFAILSVGTYYVGTYLFGFLIGLTIELISPGMITEDNEFFFGLLAVPCGLGCVVGLFYLLKNTWAGQQQDAEEYKNIKNY